MDSNVGLLMEKLLVQGMSLTPCSFSRQGKNSSKLCTFLQVYKIHGPEKPLRQPNRNVKGGVSREFNVISKPKKVCCQPKQKYNCLVLL